MRILSLDQRGQSGKIINFSVWSGIASPEGHIKMILKVTMPPRNGMIGESKYHREDIKWNGTDKDLRQSIISFLSQGKNKEFDIKQAMYQLKNLFV
jgi:hypothetical protein